MGLDFLKSKDKEGAALYIIFDGSTHQKRHWEDFISHLARNTKHQAQLFSIKDKEGEQLLGFYGFSHSSLPVLMIVRDDDQLAYSWVGSETVTQAHLISLLNQISS